MGKMKPIDKSSCDSLQHQAILPVPLVAGPQISCPAI